VKRGAFSSGFELGARDLRVTRRGERDPILTELDCHPNGCRNPIWDRPFTCKRRRLAEGTHLYAWPDHDVLASFRAVEMAARRARFTHKPATDSGRAIG
jgi:hypothetical protein